MSDVKENGIVGTTDDVATMTPESLSVEIERLRAEDPDPETAHGWIDGILVGVLDRIAAGKCTDPVECARLAVKADAELAHPRWYA